MRHRSSPGAALGRAAGYGLDRKSARRKWVGTEYYARATRPSRTDRWCRRTRPSPSLAAVSLFRPYQGGPHFSALPPATVHTALPDAPQAAEHRSGRTGSCGARPRGHAGAWGRSGQWHASARHASRSAGRRQARLPWLCQMRLSRMWRGSGQPPLCLCLGIPWRAAGLRRERHHARADRVDDVSVRRARARVRDVRDRRVLLVLGDVLRREVDVVVRVGQVDTMADRPWDRPWDGLWDDFGSLDICLLRIRLRRSSRR